MCLQTDQENPLSPFFTLCFAFPKEGRGNVSVTAYTIWLFGVGFFCKLCNFKTFAFKEQQQKIIIFFLLRP